MITTSTQPELAHRHPRRCRSGGPAGRIFLIASLLVVLGACGKTDIPGSESATPIGDATTGSDAGGDDAGEVAPDGLSIDTGEGDDASPPRLDIGLPLDASGGADGGGDEDAAAPPDVAPGCVPGTSRCDGDTLIFCDEGTGTIERRPCADEGARCTVESGVAACVFDACEPGSRSCLDDGSSGLCNDDGSGFVDTEPCAFGCDPSTGRCAPPVSEACADLPLIGVDERHELDLCGAGDKTKHVPGEIDCGETRSGGEELIFALEIDERRRVRIELKDADSERAIDTIVYLRSVCDDPATQIICSDDLSCSESDIDAGCPPFGDAIQVRHSRFEITLDPGRYYLVADQFTYDRRTSFRCGIVTLSVEGIEG